MEAHDGDIDPAGPSVSLISDEGIVHRYRGDILVAALLDKAHDTVRLDAAPFSLVDCVDCLESTGFVLVDDVELGGVGPHET